MRQRQLALEAAHTTFQPRLGPKTERLALMSRTGREGNTFERQLHVFLWQYMGNSEAASCTALLPWYCHPCLHLFCRLYESPTKSSVERAKANHTHRPKTALPLQVTLFQCSTSHKLPCDHHNRTTSYPATTIIVPPLLGSFRSFFYIAFSAG